MPTPRLPDVNSSFMRNRGECLDALRAGEPERAMMAFHALNAMLPPDKGRDGLPIFRVIISDRLYKEMHGHKIVVICPRCNAAHSHADTNIRAVRQPIEAQILGAPATAKMWTCRPESLLKDGARKGKKLKNAPTACGAENRLAACRVQDRHPSEPHYCGVVYSPPVRPPGMAGRTPFRNAFRRWAAIAYAEFEGQAAAYRDAHWKRPDEDGGMGAEYAAVFAQNLEASADARAAKSAEDAAGEDSAGDGADDAEADGSDNDDDDTDPFAGEGDGGGESEDAEA